ncbi:MAG: lantibiotic dehydratase, partial [Mucilaginibacter sp.]
MNNYHFFPVTVLRTPAFSFKDHGEPNLRRTLKNNYFQKALLIASDVVYKQLEKVDFDLDRLNPKEVNTVKKYFNRICFRPTPFGTFSTFSAVPWGQQQYIEVKKQRVHLTKSFKEELLAVRNFKEKANPKEFKYRVNQTIYETADELRYLAAFPNEAFTAFEFSIKSVSNIPLLKKLRSFGVTEKHYHEFMSFLKHEENLDDDIASGLLDELISVDFLLDHLVPNITGADYLEKTSRSFSPVNPLKNFKSTILPVSNGQLNANGNNRLTDYIKDTNQVYVNTEGVPGGSIPIDYQQKLLKALDGLYLLGTRLKTKSHLTDFIAAYEKKFEGQTLPLLFVLDPETGIGYQGLADHHDGRELIKEIAWPAGAKNELTTDWSKAHSLLLKKWHQGAPVIKLEDVDLAMLQEESPGLQLPPTISVVFRIAGNQVLIENAGGATATALIGRFTPFNSEINDLATTITKHEKEANPGVIFAEIAHICDFHTANINRRNHSYDYEIPVLTSSTLPADFQIPLSDLYLSVVRGELILYSRKHQKRVIPRLSSAFNYNKNNLSVFRLLCDLQHQGLSGNLNFELSNFFPGLNYYPRVEYADAILYPATWHLSNDDFKTATMAPEDQQQTLFNQIKDRLSLPKWVALTVHDNQLVFNLTNTGDISFFLDVVKNQLKFVLKEFLYPMPTDDILVTSKRKPLINQFIASLYRQGPVYHPVHITPEEKRRTARLLSPGSEWLYFKIYCHPARANEIITTKVYPLMQRMQKQGAVREWFFVRYTDPDFHIRLRLKVAPENYSMVSALLSNEMNRLIKKQKVASYTIAVYERELERYGFDKITNFERLFFMSSSLTATYLDLVGRKDQQLEYHIFGFQTVRLMMDCFQLSGSARIEYLEQSVTAFFTEFNGNADLRIQLDLKFRKLQQSLNQVT